MQPDRARIGRDEGRARRPVPRFGIAVLSLLLPVLPIRAETLSPDGAEGAIAALSASVEVERDLLKSQQDVYRQTAIEREDANRRVQQSLAELDSMAASEGGPSAPALAAKQREIADAEARRILSSQRCLEILGRIREIQERIAGLEKKIAALRDSAPGTREALTGAWRVNYLPSGNRGLFVLRQSGTIVQGQYQLDGGWKGSLQGTYIDGKLYLQRIDSKLGRSSELEGYLGQDGRSIRGTWRNLNLTDGAVASGSWTASRQDD